MNVTQVDKAGDTNIIEIRVCIAGMHKSVGHFHGNRNSHLHAQDANICRSQQQVLHETCQEVPRIERKQTAQDIDYVNTINESHSRSCRASGLTSVCDSNTQQYNTSSTLRGSCYPTEHRRDDQVDHQDSQED